MTNKNDQLVVGLYANPEAAKDAGDAIKAWDHKDHDVKLGAVAVITYDHKKDKLNYDEIGQRSTKTGAGWGTALGAAVGILSGGIALIPGMLAGAAAGGALGTLNHRSLGVTDEQQAKLMAALKSGGAALGVMADDFEVDPVVAHMAETGGDVSHYQVEVEVAEAITVAAAAQAAASEVVDEVVETSEEVAEAVKAVTVDAADLGDDAAAAVGKIVAVTGLSVDDASRLYNVGIVKASDFLEVAALPDGREAICEATGLDHDTVLYGAKRLDLMRVNGVGVKYSALLLASGVDTVPELATRNPANLSAKMADVDAKKGITEVVPTEEVTADWVGQAKELPRMLYY
jgi:uncharacterized membrane protein/predicted flap endonuclease-1-like 5' DNA nuclease